MGTYMFTCLCSEVMTVNADTRKEAITKMKELMSKEKTQEHIKEKHANDRDGMTVGHIYALIEQKIAQPA